MSLDILGLRGEADRLKDGGQGGANDFLSNFVKFPDGPGAVVVRLLGPATAGMFGRPKHQFYCSTRIHRVNGKSIHCLKNLEGSKFNGDCPICRYYNWLWQESERKGPEEAAALQAQARAIKPIERYYYNCIVRKEIDESGAVHENVGPKILSVGKTLHKMIIKAIVGCEELDEPALGDVTDIKTGRDFKIIKTMRASGKDNFPNYDTSKFLDASPLGNPEQVKTWFETVHDLAALRTLRDPEELKTELKKHLGLIPNEDNSDGFDPSEYTAGGASEEPQVRSAPPVVTAPAVKSEVEKAAAVANGSESVPDEDFYKTLQGLT